MPVTVVCFCRYFAARHTKWRPEDFDAYKFVHALKGKDLNGYGYVPVAGVKKRLSNLNVSSAIDWFAIFVANYLTRKKIKGPFAVVPIPNSSCTVSSSVRPHTRKLAKAICETLGDESEVVDCLRWKKNLGSASAEGGPRDAEVLYGNLVLSAKSDELPTVILVDDVMTSGGHLKASAAKLRKAGANVVIAVCGGRTTYDQDKGAFDIVEEMLTDYTP